MSNDGTALQSCSPSNNVTNGDSSTQVAFYYEEEGVVQLDVLQRRSCLEHRN